MASVTIDVPEAVPVVPRRPCSITAQRVALLTEDDPLLICNEDHRFIAAEQMRGIGMSRKSSLNPSAGYRARGRCRITRDPGLGILYYC